MSSSIIFSLLLSNVPILDPGIIFTLLLCFKLKIYLLKFPSNLDSAVESLDIRDCKYDMQSSITGHFYHIQKIT